jgi:tetratricopeptide (TPR) repeat protein
MLQGGAIAGTTALDYSNRGIGKQAKGDLDGAIADYNRALELNPKYATAWQNRSVAKRAKGDVDGSNADYNRAIELNRSRQ